MARVRRHQRRRAAGVLHSLRDLRVRRALNSWLEMACKCSPRRHPPPLSHRCGARSTRGSRWRALARHRSAPSRAPSSACATIASCVRSTRGSKRPLIGGRHASAHHGVTLPPFPTGAFNSWIETSAHRRTAQRRMRSAINELRGSCLRAGWYRWSLRIHSSRRHRGLFARLRHRGPIASDCV
jgi:hypothetical protein